MSRLPGPYSLQHAARLRPPRPRLRFRVSLLTGHWTLLGGHWSAELARHRHRETGEHERADDAPAPVADQSLADNRVARLPIRVPQLAIDL